MRDHADRAITCERGAARTECAQRQTLAAHAGRLALRGDPARGERRCILQVVKLGANEAARAKSPAKNDYVDSSCWSETLARPSRSRLLRALSSTHLAEERRDRHPLRRPGRRHLVQAEADRESDLQPRSSTLPGEMPASSSVLSRITRGEIGWTPTMHVTSLNASGRRAIACMLALHPRQRLNKPTVISRRRDSRLAN